MSSPIQTSIAPWFTLRDCARAVEFYKKAFGAVETYRLEIPDGGLIVRLNISGAEFWLSSGANVSDGKENLGGEHVRMILTVEDPHSFFKNAIEAGAVEIYPVQEEHGWRLGRIEDPFGMHWEIGHLI
ncbi:MAG: glyoxalase [Bacteroidetes bacterium]|nr:MAG: glyoxalase [Bacteroidota bacterium]